MQKYFYFGNGLSIDELEFRLQFTGFTIVETQPTYENLVNPF